MYNILLACDNIYYNKWAKNCIKSIQYFVPWIDITVIIVNPDNLEKIPNVRYIYDYMIFDNEDSKISYYQAVRFLKCAEIFTNEQLIMSIDCDSILTKSFTKEDFSVVCETIHVQRHQKTDRWMAGVVTYGKDNLFRNKLRENLLSIPIKEWKYGWDQDVLNCLSKTINYELLYVNDWMGFGKGGKFLTLKGDQKITHKYLMNYNEVLNIIK